MTLLLLQVPFFIAIIREPSAPAGPASAIAGLTNPQAFRPWRAYDSVSGITANLVWPAAEASYAVPALVAIADQYNVVVLADEVYERLVYDTHEALAPSFARVETNRDRLIVVNSFSKTYNMTGWRLGWAQTSEATIKTMYKAVEFMTSNPAAMGGWLETARCSEYSL